MNEVNKTLYIPLYGKAMVSKKNIILNDKMAESIWNSQSFVLSRKSKSKWLCYNMAMRARVFDDWTNSMLEKHPEATIFHIGCGLDGRVKRVKKLYKNWYDADFPDVIEIRKNYYSENDCYHMISLNAADKDQVLSLPGSESAIIILEGISMYLTNSQLRNFFSAIQNKYEHIYILMDVYTIFGAKASKYKNPINEVGVTLVYGIDDINELLRGLDIKLKKEHSMTPKRLVDELGKVDRFIFRLLFTGKISRKIYRLYELESLS